MCKYLFESLLSVTLGIYSKVEFLDYIVILFLIFLEEPPYCFPQRLYHLIFPPVAHRGSNFSTSLPKLSSFLLSCLLSFSFFLSFFFLIVAILMVVRWWS